MTLVNATLMENSSEFICYVIYDKPRDYPDRYVARRWVGGVPDEKPISVVRELRHARKAIPNHFFCVGRQVGDDVGIIETWV